MNIENISNYPAQKTKPVNQKSIPRIFI